MNLHREMERKLVAALALALVAVADGVALHTPAPRRAVHRAPRVQNCAADDDAAPTTRRSLLLGVAASTALVGLPRGASASLSAELAERQAALVDAQGEEAIAGALSRLTELVREYEGLPSDQAREALVNLMRKKRSALSGGPEWAGAAEEEYNRLMRATDPWRVTELKPIAQTSIFLLGPVYIATLAVQQLVPALFNGAYAIGAAVLLGPLLFQILTG